MLQNDEGVPLTVSLTALDGPTLPKGDRGRGFLYVKHYG